MNSETFKLYFEIAQSFVNILAVVIGGIWGYTTFVLRRKKFPKAKIHHELRVTPIGNNKILLTIFINFENISEVLIVLSKIKLTALQIAPLHEVLIEKLHNKQDIKDFLISIMEEPEQWSLESVPWPCLNEVVIKQNEFCFVEPGDFQQFVYDLVIDENIKTIRVSSFFENLTLSENRKKRLRFRTKKENLRLNNYGWNYSSMFDINFDK